MASGDVVINLSEPKTRTEKNALKRTFYVSKASYQNKELQVHGPGKFPGAGPGAAAKKMANSICQKIAPNEECTIELWMKEKLKDQKKQRDYGYIARRYKSDKKIPLVTIKPEKFVTDDAKKELKVAREKFTGDSKDIDRQVQKVAEGLLNEEGRKQMEEAREKLKSTQSEDRWYKDENGQVIGFYQTFNWGIELKSLRKRKDKDGKEVIEEGSVIETVAE